MAQATMVKQSVAPPVRAYVALAIGVMCIGMSAIWVRWAGVSGPASALYRVLIAGVVLVPVWLLRRPMNLPRRAVLLALAGGVFFAVDIALWNTAIIQTSAANATLLANNAPFWVGVGTLVIFRERLPRLFWLGMVIALLGAALIVGSDLLNHPQLGRGDLLAVSAGMFYAAYMLTTGQARAQLDTLTFMALAIITSIIVLLGLCWVTGTALTGYSAQTWGALAGLGLVSHLGGWFAINYALGHIRPSMASVSLLGQPVLTALLSIPLLGEYLSGVQIIGGLLVLGGIYIVNRR